MWFTFIISVYVLGVSYNQSVQGAPQDVQTMALMAAGTMMEVMNNGAGAHMQRSVEVMGMHTSGGFGIGFGEAGKARQRREARLEEGQLRPNSITKSDKDLSFESSGSDSSSDSSSDLSSESASNSSSDSSSDSSSTSSSSQQEIRKRSITNISSNFDSSAAEKRDKRNTSLQYTDDESADSSDESDSGVSLDASEEKKPKRSAPIYDSTTYLPKFTPARTD